MHTRDQYGLSSDEVEEVREIFQHFDTDGNGTMDAQELGRLLRALGAESDPQEVAMGLSIVDEDGNGVIEFDEFLRWWSDSRSR